MSAALHTVHVRVNDAATGQPTPCRIRFTGPDGTYYAPFGRLTEFATGRGEAVGGNLLLGAKRFAYIDGSCEVPLPAGTIGLEIAKGPEYRPICQELPLGPGKMALRFTLERWTNARQDGWYSGDTRAHFLSPSAALLEAAAEDLAVVNVLAQEGAIPDAYGRKYPTIANILEFSGQRPALECPGHMVVVNTHNSHPILGSLALLNCHRPVYPLTFGGPEGRDNWTLADWCGQCHRKGGLVVWTRIGQANPEFPYGEALADLIRGDVDALELDSYEDSPFDALGDWYTFLSCGLRVTPAGASGKDSNGLALGAMRTYARLPLGAEVTYKNWIEAVRAGRVVITNGPLLTFTLNGHDPGALIDLPDSGGVLQVRAEARSLVPFDHLEIVVDGLVIAGQAGSGSPTSAALELELPLTKGAWVAARCRGQQLLPSRPASQRIFAHSAPIYVRVSGLPSCTDPGKSAGLLAHLDDMHEWVATKARCETDRQRENLAAIFQNACKELRRRARGDTASG